jgi:feruloyl-CoA synthase
MSAPQYHAARVGGCLQAEVEQRSTGSQVLRSTEALGEYPARLTDRLEHWAAAAPDRTFVARRDPAVQGGGDWIRIT